MIRRLPIRIKLTLAFSLAMVAVLTATSLFLYFRLRTELDHGLSQKLHTRLGVTKTLLANGDGSPRRAIVRGASSSDGGGFAEIVAPGGRVIAATEELPARSLLPPSQLPTVAVDGSIVDLVAEGADLGAVRLLVAPVKVNGRSHFAIIGASLENRNQALSNLRALLLIGEPIALLLASLGAYGVVSAALRPVEAMRVRAAQISSDDLGQRLPLSPGEDELRSLGETLNEMLGRVEAGMERERAFVADASHEFRTPLATLRTELELIAQERPKGAALDQAIAAAIGDTDRLARLTDDLLQLARADRDRVALSLDAVEPGELLAAVAGRYPDADVAVEDPTASSLQPGSTVDLDSGRIEQALANLVDNALRYGAPPVRLSARGGPEEVELHVTDRGPGFEPGFLEHAFERFTQADPGHGMEGSGLGLAIVRSIAESHGGSAHLANRAGGADAWIALPRERRVA